MIKLKISKDSKRVAKIVLINDKFEALMLTRSDDHKKFPGELDLPGGHAKVGEKIVRALKREVEEETGIRLSNTSFFSREGNKYFFYAKYDGQNITLSAEHTKFAFYNKNKLDKEKKFENIAIKVIKRVRNDKNWN